MEKELRVLESHLRKQHRKRIEELDQKILALKEKKELIAKQDQTYSVRAVKNKAAEEFLGDNKHRKSVQDHLSQQREIKHYKKKISDLKNRIEGRSDEMENLEGEIQELENKKGEVAKEAGVDLSPKKPEEEEESDSDSEDEEIKRMMAELNREKANIAEVVSESQSNFQDQIDTLREKVEKLNDLDKEVVSNESRLKQAEQKWEETCSNIPTELIKMESEFLQLEEQLDSIKKDVQEVNQDLEGEDDEEERESMGEEIEELLAQGAEIQEEMEEMESSLVVLQKQVSTLKIGEDRTIKIKEEIQKLKKEKAMLEEYVEMGLDEKTKKTLKKLVGDINKLNTFCEDNGLKVGYSLNVKVKKEILFQVKEVVHSARLSRILTVRQFAKRIKWMGKGSDKFGKIVGKAVIVDIADCRLELKSLLYAVAKQNFTLKVLSRTQREIGELQVALETVSSDHFDAKEESELIGLPLEIRIDVKQLTLKHQKVRKCFVQFAFYEEDEVETRKMSGNTLVYNFSKNFKIDSINEEVIQYLNNSSVRMVVFGDLFTPLEKRVVAAVNEGGDMKKGGTSIAHGDEEEDFELPAFKFKKIRVTCYEADGLRSARKMKLLRSMNPYIKLKFRGSKKKTTIWKKKQNPQWLQTIVLNCKNGKYNEKLTVQVANNERLSRNAVIGETDLEIRKCFKVGKLATWFRLKNKEGDAGRVKLSFEFL